MAPLGYVWRAVTTFMYSITLSPLSGLEQHQQPIGGKSKGIELGVHNVDPPPLFEPPGTNIQGFQCDYTESMPEWTSCQTDTDKSCWLRNTVTQETLGVTDDYETANITGIVRNYTLVVEDGWWNADGMNFTEAKLINGSYPGPLIEACWGDILNVTVINNMTYNGTSIHWHGLRQLNSMHMDGVNGVTQCPIAPKDQFTYTFKTTQYGSSWLHSHYSVQYADGVQAPLTIHGPTSANYDYPIDPLIMSDWGHNSAFEAQFPESGGVLNASLTLNGTGNLVKFTGDLTANTTVIPDPYVMVFNHTVNPVTGSARYLLRLINTAYESGLIFSIDNHTLQIVEVDFVPIVSNATVNHTSNSILVAIGQRYHAIVETLPQCLPVNGQYPPDCNFWIRTFIASGCADNAAPPTDVAPNYMETGILRYNYSDPALPNSLWQWPDLELDCVENYDNFVPTFHWTIKPPANNLTRNGEEFDVGFNQPGPFALASFSFSDAQTAADYSFQTTYGNPTFLNLANFAEAWPVGWMVIPENYTDANFTYFVITDHGHPIHLHGHDFAILRQDYETHYTPDLALSCNATDPKLKLNCDNPPRRDVVVLAGSGFGAKQVGYVVIAFKTDNPGTWLMHCHIAFHASSGLALQIMERQKDANVIWPPGNSPALAAAQHTCAKWNDWSYDCKNYWPGKQNGTYPSCDAATLLQNDSGI